MITAALTAIVLSSAIAVSIDDVDVISLQNAGGEYLRKAYQSKDVLSATSIKYTFYFSETEGNDTIVGLSLYGAGASVTLGDGTEFAEQVVNIAKTATTSLLIYWTVEVV